VAQLLVRLRAASDHSSFAELDAIRCLAVAVA